MRKLLLLFTLVVSTFCFAQTNDNYSATALLVRQSSNGTLTVMQIPNPRFSHDISSDVANTPPDKILLVESVFMPAPSQPFQTGTMMVIWTDQTDNDIWIFTGDDDPSLTGQFLAVTNSITTVESVIRDKIHNKL